MRRVLTKRNEQFIKDNYRTMTDKQIGSKLGVVKGTITSARKRLKLRCTMREIVRRRGLGMIGKCTLKLTWYQRMKIKRDYLNTPVKRLAAQMGISDTALKTAMNKMGLVIPTTVIEQRKLNTRFAAGAIPANKGRRQVDYMSKSAIARTAKTRFKKGNIPPNTKGRDGVITVRHDHPERHSSNNQKPYKYIRVSIGKWKPLHQFKWEKKYGKVPPGMCLWFKDGNTLNVKLNNIEIISLKENRIRNSASVNLTNRYVAFTLASKMHPEMVEEYLKYPELITIKRKQLQLKRTINDKERDRK